MLLDVTRLLRPGMPVYPGEPSPELAPVKRMSQGDRADVSKLMLGLHTGTHVDAPRHFLAGKPGVDELPLEALCGPAQVVAILDERAVTVRELERLEVAAAPRLLFKTRNGKDGDDRFHPDYVYITPDAAAWMVRHRVLLAGIDGPSVEQFDSAEPATHRTLLTAGIVIVENLDLRYAAPGRYHLTCLPLKVKDGDGAPCRAVLIPVTT